MDSPSTRTAEIVALRRRVAGGSRDIERVYFPLAQLLASAGERDEAIAVYRAAMQAGTEDGFFLKAIACLRAAQALAPGDRTLAEDETRLRATIDPGLWARAARQSEGRTAMLPIPDLDGHYRSALERCTISWSARDGVADVTIDHPNASVPTDWIERARYALVFVDGCTEPIPCTAVVTDAQRTSHRLTLTPASPTAAAAMRWNVRVREETGQSNIAALLITGNGEPHPLRNVYHDAPVMVPN
ncbi:MAG: hypothetical protein Q7R80_03630 [bacterium]|nr:hypothetical protein [bacterium]